MAELPEIFANLTPAQQAWVSKVRATWLEEVVEHVLDPSPHSDGSTCAHEAAL